MKHTDFHIGLEFFTSNDINHRFRVTDVGTRTIVAIPLDRDDDHSWYGGPPYAIEEIVFDEYDFDGCDQINELETAKKQIVKAMEDGNVTFAPGLEESIRSMSHDSDFTITSTTLAQTWGKPEIVVGAFDDPPPCSTTPGGFEIHWRTVSAGGGCTTFYVLADGKLRCDNETMSPDFVKAVLSHLVDQAEFDD